jgi:NAD(P)-dependent dehydrogenase (short-subunit alcohol dehydrogenase family)
VYHICVGASSGIGAETALHFVKLGARVVITGRNEANLEDTKRKCLAAEGAHSNQVVSVIGDVSKSADCSIIVKTAIDSFGSLDVLVGC